MQKANEYSVKLTQEYVHKTFEEAYRYAREKNKGRLMLENTDTFPKDENGYIIMTEEQYEHYYPDAEPIDDFFRRLEGNG